MTAMMMFSASYADEIVLDVIDNDSLITQNLDELTVTSLERLLGKTT